MQTDGLFFVRWCAERMRHTVHSRHRFCTCRMSMFIAHIYMLRLQVCLVAQQQAVLVAKRVPLQAVIVVTAPHAVEVGLF